jgi:hypothetical protein
VKLLFFGDLAATGFGTVTSDLGRALHRARRRRALSSARTTRAGWTSRSTSRTLDV